MPPSMTPDYRTLPVKLTETERMARAMTAAELQSKYCTVEERKKEDDEKKAKAEKVKRDAAETTAAPSKARNGAKKDSGRPKTRRSTSASKDPNPAS